MGPSHTRQDFTADVTHLETTLVTDIQVLFQFLAGFSRASFLLQSHDLQPVPFRTP